MSSINPFSIIGSLLSSLLPDTLVVPLQNLIDKFVSLLQGETVLVIGNGAAVVYYLIAKGVGSIPDQSFEDSLKAAGAGIVAVNTVLVAIRQFVSSPKTVARIVATPPAGAGPQAAAVAEGVAPELIVEAVAEADKAVPTEEPSSELNDGVDL